MSIDYLLKQLKTNNIAHISLDGSSIITVRLLDDPSKLSLSTAIYAGDQYIPPSVRKCLSSPLPNIIHPPLATFPTIDESLFCIHLHYVGLAHPLTQQQLASLLDRFETIAARWRLHLDKHDKDDLVYVRAR